MSPLYRVVSRVTPEGYAASVGRASRPVAQRPKAPPVRTRLAMGGPLPTPAGGPRTAVTEAHATHTGSHERKAECAARSKVCGPRRSSRSSRPGAPPLQQPPSAQTIPPAHRFLHQRCQHPPPRSHGRCHAPAPARITSGAGRRRFDLAGNCHVFQSETASRARRKIAKARWAERRRECAAHRPNSHRCRRVTTVACACMSSWKAWVPPCATACPQTSNTGLYGRSSSVRPQGVRVVAGSSRMPRMAEEPPAAALCLQAIGLGDPGTVAGDFLSVAARLHALQTPPLLHGPCR